MQLTCKTKHIDNVFEMQVRAKALTIKYINLFRQNHVMKFRVGIFMFVDQNVIK